MVWRKLLLIVALTITVQAAISDQRPEYTQNLETFKADKYKIRMQMLVGCWLMTREYLPLGNQKEKAILIKVCLKHINRKDSVVKITSLIGKNITSTKTYQQIVPSSQIPQLSSLSGAELTEFDSYLIEMLNKYELDLVKVQGDEGKELRKKVEQQVQKRTTVYYFGIIPKNKWTHLLMLVSISFIIVMVFTCWKYFNLKKSQTDQKQKACDKHSSDYFKNASNFTKSPQGQLKKTQ